jgi:hypothetical protein
MSIQIFSNHCPPGSGGATIRKNTCTCFYIENKYICSRTRRPISIKLCTNNLSVRGILNCSNLEPGPLQRGDNHKNANMGCGHSKNLLKNHWTRRVHIYMTAFWYSVDLSLFKSWSPEVERGHSRENHIYMCLYWKNSTSPKPAGQFQTNLLHIILG